MTIAAGFTANDGIVLCADTQETISGYTKTHDGKIVLTVYQDMAMVIAGAGTLDYIQTAREAIHDGFPDRAVSMGQVSAHLKNKLLGFFDEHIARWAYFPDRERPSVQLLIGITGKKIPPALFHYDGTAFCMVRHKAIGAGILLANDLINNYCFGNFTVSQLANIGIYILAKVKRGVDGCGGSTHVIGLRKGRDFSFTEKDVVDKLEEELLAIEDDSAKAFVKAIAEKGPALSWQSEFEKKRKQLESKPPLKIQKSTDRQ
jgi:20S proteasome alpha/beta subunit